MRTDRQFGQAGVRTPRDNLDNLELATPRSLRRSPSLPSPRNLALALHVLLVLSARARRLVISVRSVSLGLGGLHLRVDLAVLLHSGVRVSIDSLTLDWDSRD